jgi:hypothetical protein
MAGWLQESELPWKEPSKGLELPAFDLAALTSKIDPTNLGATVEGLAEDFKVLLAHSAARLGFEHGVLMQWVGM